MAKKKASQYFVWIILILVGIGLLGFGTGGLGGTIRSLGTVGSKEISIAGYQNALNQQSAAYAAQTGERISLGQALALGLDQRAMQQIINRKAIENEATELGLSVGNDQVLTRVMSNPAFRGRDGTFDRTTYRDALSRENTTERNYEAGIRDELASVLLQGAILSGIPDNDTFGTTIGSYLGERRDATIAFVDATALDNPPADPTEADREAFYNANPDRFTSLETRAITYVWLTPDMIQDELEVDETALREQYEDRLAEFNRPERRIVERLAFSDTEAASAAIDALENDGLSFDALVAEQGLDLADVDMGDVTRDDLASAAGEGVFSATTGDVIGPVESAVGPALFRINAVLPADNTSFEEARPDLRDELAAARARRVISETTEGISDLLARGASLEDLASETDLRRGSVDWTVETEDGIAGYDNFRDAAAVVQEGAFPDLLDLSDGGIFALRLDGINPPALLPITDVAEDLTLAVAAQKEAEAIRARSEELAAQIQPLTSFTSLDLTAQDADGLTRRSFVDGTPPGFINTLFEMETGEVRVVDNLGQAIIVRLDGINDADPEAEDTAAQIEAASQQAASGIAQDLFTAFAQEILSDTDIQIDENALLQLNAQMQ